MFIYLHGFNSGGNASKAYRLRTMFAPIPLLSPTYPAHRVTQALEFLRAYITDARRKHPAESRLVLVGSSLGGSYAQYLAHEMHTGLVLINPSINPHTTLLGAVGNNRNEATGEEYELTRDDVLALERLRPARCDPSIPTLLLLDTGDELLDYRVAEDWYRGCGKTMVFPGGNHRFAHLDDAAVEIRKLHDGLQAAADSR